MFADDTSLTACGKSIDAGVLNDQIFKKPYFVSEQLTGTF